MALPEHLSLSLIGTSVVMCLFAFDDTNTEISPPKFDSFHSRFVLHTKRHITNNVARPIKPVGLLKMVHLRGVSSKSKYLNKVQFKSRYSDYV